MITTFRLTAAGSHPLYLQEIADPMRDGVYGVINLDYDRDGKSRPTRTGAPHRTDRPVPIGVARRDGLPATCPLMVYEPDVIMTQDIQLWINEINRARSGQNEIDAGKSFQQLFAKDKFATNKWGAGDEGESECGADYVNGTNLGREPIRLMRLLTAGAVLKITGFKTLFGVACWEFEAINALGNYRQYTPETHPWLFYSPTNSVREETLTNKGVWNGYSFRENISDPFPQYKTKTALPIFTVDTRRQSLGYGYIEKSRVRLLKETEPFPSPFVK